MWKPLKFVCLYMHMQIYDKGNAEAHQLLQTPIEKVQTSNRKQKQCS